MGCLIWLHKYAESGSRLKFYASPEKTRDLFSYCMLDRVLTIVETCPEPTDEFLVLTMVDIESSEMGRHIAECHQRLAELGSNEAKRFKSIADRLRRDLRNRSG
jgi:hypothetical protein